jgi:hypothetical protein
VQITSDQLQGYKYAQEHKTFRNIKVEGHEWMKFRVDPLVGVEREAIHGAPNLKTSTVAHMERFFLTMRQGSKRTARKTLAYSKDWQNHALMSSVFIFVYNMVRRHETTKTTPAMALGITDKRWTLEDVVEMTDAYVAAQEAEAFEKAFSKFQTKPSSQRTFNPTPKDKIPLPWYLNPDSEPPSEKGMTD